MGRIQRAANKIKSAAKKQLNASKQAYVNVGNAIIGAAKNIKRVGTGNQSANALQATTLPGAGKVFTGNTPQQKAKQQREQSIANGTAANGQSKFTQADKDIRLALKKNNYNQINQTLKPGGTTNKASGNVPMRNDAQRNNSYGDPIAEGFGGINTASNEQAGTSTLGRQTTGTPTTSVVNAQDIAGTKRPDLAGTNPDDYLIDYSSTIPGLQQQTDLQKAESESESITDKWLKNMSQTPDIAGIESKIRNQLGIEQKQQEVNSLQGQLNAIVAQGQQNQLRVVGQGRGIPEAILGGQQAQFARETAIASLPVSAQLEAAQGNLEMANESLDRLFKIYSDQAQNEYNAKNRMFEVMSSISDKKVQRLFEEKKIQNDRDYQEKRDLYKEQIDYSKMAYANGQSSLGAKISKLDYKSTTFREDLAKLTGQLYDPARALDTELKRAQIDKIKSETASANGSGNLEVNRKIALAANKLSEMLTSGTGTAAVGKSALFSTSRIPGTEAANFRINTDTLKSLLTLDNLKYLKGPTSDKDIAFLMAAGTTLNRSQSEREFGNTLNGIISTYSKYVPELNYVENVNNVIQGSNYTTQASTNAYINQVLNN